MRMYLVAVLALLIPSRAMAAEYQVDLGMVLDFEDIRPLIEACADIGELEDHRSAFDSAGDLEDFRGLLENLGYVIFSGCPSEIEAHGVKRIS